MRVLYVHEHFHTLQAGGGLRPYEMALRLIQRGHQVTMVVGGDRKTFGLTETDNKNILRGNIDGIDVIQIATPYSNRDGLMKRTKTFLKFAALSTRVAMKADYDIAIASSTPLTAGIPCILAKWFRGKKYVFEVRDLWPELPKALGMTNKLALWGMSVLERCSYRNAAACIGLAPGIVEGIARKSQKGKRIAMIPNGCDLDVFSPGKREDLVLEGVTATDTVAVFAGSHGKANGLDAVLDAARVLKARGRNNIKLCLIGDGKLKPHLMERARSENLGNCLFVGFMSKTEVSKIVGCADIGMQILANVPAFYYGTSPNKFFDYLTAGRPVLNNYPGWLADMIRENECGVAVEPDNPEAFADGLELLADHPDLREKYGRNARTLAEREFDRNILGARFVDFLESINDLR